MPSSSSIPDSFDLKITIKDALNPKNGLVYRQLLSAKVSERRRAEKALIKIVSPALFEVIRSGYLYHLVRSSPKKLHPKSILPPIPERFTLDTFNAAKTLTQREWGRPVEDMILGRRQMAEMRQIACQSVAKPTKIKTRKKPTHKEIDSLWLRGTIISVNMHEKNVENWLELVYTMPFDPLTNTP